MVSTFTTFILPIEEAHLGMLNEWSKVIELERGGQILKHLDWNLDYWTLESVLNYYPTQVCVQWVTFL